MKQVHKFKEAMFWTDEFEILYCKPIDKKINHKLELNKVKKYINAIKKLSKGKPMPFLIDLRDIRGTFSISAAKELSKNQELVQLRLSEAFVVNSIGMKILVLSYKRLFDLNTPFKLFNNMELAKEYCKHINNESYGGI